MKKKIILSGVFLLIAVLLIIGYKTLRQNKVCFKQNCFFVELAKTPSEQSRGLMFRKYLAPDKGMLFIFEEEKNHPFWMKNTLIPLDMIWIDKNKKIVFISKNNQPCKIENCDSINPDKKSIYVLELNSGIAEKIGLTIGDKINFDLKL